MALYLSEGCPKLTPRNLDLVGFAFARDRAVNPWFCRADFMAFVPDACKDLAWTAYPGNFAFLVSEMVDLGVLEATDERRRKSGRPHKLAHITDAGQEVLMGNLVHGVTQRGMALTDMLHIPFAFGTILERSDFQDRVGQSVIGLGWTATFHHVPE